MNVDLEEFKTNISVGLNYLWFDLDKKGYSQLLFHCFLDDPNAQKIANYLAPYIYGNKYLVALAGLKGNLVYVFDKLYRDDMNAVMERSKLEFLDLMNTDSTKLLPGQLVALISGITGLEEYRYLPLNYCPDDDIFITKMSLILNNSYFMDGDYCFVVTQFSKM